MTTGAEIRSLDLRGLAITTSVAVALHEAIEPLEVGATIEARIEPFAAIRPDLEAWAQAAGHTLEMPAQEDGRLVRVVKGEPRVSDRSVAIVISHDGLEELLSPLGFALAAALEGAACTVYLQGPAVRVLRPGYEPALPWPMRPFSRFARAGLESTGHPPAIEKLRQLQRLGGHVYACGPSLDHFKVDPSRLAIDDVIVCEYLTFMAVMQQADVQLYP